MHAANLDGKIERHKSKDTQDLQQQKETFYKLEREHGTQIVAYAQTGILILALLAASPIMARADQTSSVSHQIMTLPLNGTQPVLSSQIKINATQTSRQHLNHLRRQSTQTVAAPAELPAGQRAPRIYRIRAAGSNGLFATNAALRVGAPPSSPPPLSETAHATAEREIEGGSTSGPNGTTMAEQEQFGARQPSRQHAATAATKLVQHQQKCAHQQQVAPPLDGEATAEASSVSASSQTLRLAPRPVGAGQQVVAVQQSQLRRPTASRGEIDESLLAMLHEDHGEPAAQVVAANKHSQSLAAAAAAAANTSTSGSGLAAEAATEIERQTRPQATKQAADSNSASNSNLLSLIDEFDSKITTNKTRAQLSCDSGEMVIKLNFTEPFKGIVYPDRNRLSPCRFFGDGHHNYELRLPLRGCGTRQVAPRVFVNDVIVRFHKTLELEEDEVKTLICRYPPPLDITTSGGAGQQVAAGNGLVHELDDRRHPEQSQHSNRPGESALQPNQFELLEPTTSGRPTNRFGNGGGGGGSQLETNAFGELLAPPGGHQRQPIGDLINLTPAERILLRQHAKTVGGGGMHDNLLMAPSLGNGQQQRTNSRLFNPEATSVLLDERGNLVRANNSSPSTSASNYFDRLTSIELLFLISSLMFLVLLALGLAGSYFCLSGRRDRRRHRHHSVGVLSNQTGGRGGGGAGLLHRKRRHLSPTASLYQTSGGHLAGAGSRYQSPSGQLLAHPNQQQHHLYNPAAHRPAYYYQQYLAQAQAQQQQQQPQPPSSPDDSDVSGQMLLPTGRGGAPSGGDAVTNRLASVLGPNNAAPGRRFNYHAAAPAHYHASTLRPSRGHHQLASHAGPQVVGRRGPHTNQQAPTTTNALEFQGAQTQPSTATLGRRAMARPGAAAAAAQASFVSSHEPLLKMAPPLPNALHALTRNPVAANQTLARIRHARSLQQLREEETSGHFGAEHAFGADWLRVNQQVLGASGKPAVQRHCSVHTRHGHHPSHHLNNHKIKLKQQQHHYDTSNLVSARPVLVAQQHAGKPGTSSAARQQQVASINYAEDDDLNTGTGSDQSDQQSTCSSELAVNDQQQQQQQVGERPKLILKSIEDSFVTNFTEIYEQEYKRLDTRRPLSMAEWRRASEAVRGGGRVSSTSGDTSSDEDKQGADEATGGGGASGTLKSSQTNLRSLTELDVNFAKSLLRPSLAATATSANQQHRRDAHEQQVAPSEGKENKPTVEKLVRQQPADEQTSKPPNSSNNNNNNEGEQGDAQVKPETPDLVISPEYNVGQRLRLASGRRKESRPPGGDESRTSSRASHESISYV